MSALLWTSAAAAMAAVSARFWCVGMRRLGPDLAGIQARLDALLLARGHAFDDQGPQAPAFGRAIDALLALEQQAREQFAGESTRREHAEARLRESEQRYALAVRGANDG